MNAGTGCPDHETLAAFLFGKLPPEQEGAVSDHLEQCATCEQQAQRIEGRTDRLIDALRRPAPVVVAGEATEIQRTPPQPALEAGPVRLEGYRILAEIGRGGMGVVYRAFQHRLNRLVAIKMILAGQLANPEDRVRFQLEGELLGRLHHPNFVQVYEVGTLEVAGGAVQPYLVLEHVDGGSLKNKLTERPLDYREAARLVLVLARAMEAAHAQGIVHRDLKPANVLIDRDGTLKITDFGLAKELSGGASLTPAGATLGTPGYMAPEQARGGMVGPGVDVYALGAILYELLTGRPPFVGDTPVVVVLQVLQQPPSPLRQLRPGIPRDLEVICLKCLEKEVGRRYPRAADLARDLECWLENRPIRARPAGKLERVSKWARRHPLPAALIAFLVLSLILGSAVSTYYGVTAMRRAAEAQDALDKEAEAHRRADKATEAVRWERYLAEIAAASNAMRLSNVGPARRALEGAPAHYRNWEWLYLRSQLDGAGGVLDGHKGRVFGISFSPDGKRLASASDDRTVRLWDVRAGKEVAALRIPSGFVSGVHFSPDGSRLVSGTSLVRLWDATTGDLRWEATSNGNAMCPIWSPDGRFLAACGADGLMRVWDAATGHEVFSKPCSTERRLVAFSPDSRHVAAAQKDYFIQIWEVATGNRTVELRGHRHTCSAMSYSSDGQRIATGSIFPENEVRLWNAGTGEVIEVGKGHVNEVTALRFSSDGYILASGSMDQTIRLWDGTNGRPRAALEGHTGSVNALAFGPDGTRLVSASADQTLRLWHPADGRLLGVLCGHTSGVNAVAFAPRGGLIASSSDDGTVRIWDPALVARNGVLRGHTSFVYDVAFNPAGTEVASAAWDHTVRVWDLATGRERAVLTHTDAVLPALAYSPDGRKIAVVVREQGIWLWDLATRKPTRLWTGFAGTKWGDVRLAFHPQGTLLAWGSMEGPVRLWDLAKGRGAAVLPGSPSGTRDVAFRPDGHQLAAASPDGTVRLWDIASRRQQAVLHGSPDTHRIVYSADGRLLAAGAGDKTVRIWAVATGKEVGVVVLGSTVYSVAFKPDGTRLACGCKDNTIRLLDVDRLQEVAELRGHRAYVHAVQLSSDGTRLASASGDFTVRIWDSLSLHDRAASAQPK
jgi:WD40 repeat protein